MSQMSYFNSELGCRNWRQIQAGVLRVTGRCSDGDSGVGPTSPAIRAAIGTASRRYAEGLPPREHEGTPVQRGGWRVESGFCFRSETQSHPARCRGQIRGQREAVLPGADPQSRRAFRGPPDLAEKGLSQEEGEMIMPTNVNDIIRKLSP